MKGTEKIIITMPDMMEQMDISDKTIHRMIEEGELPDFTYGSRFSKKKGWHSSVLERHAMEKYEKSQSIKNACNTSQILTEDVTVMSLSNSHRAMTKQSTNLDDRDSFEQKLSCKKMPKCMRSSTRQSRVATGFTNI